MNPSKNNNVNTARPPSTVLTIVSRRSTREEQRQQEKALDVLLAELVRQQLRESTKQ